MPNIGEAFIRGHQAGMAERQHEQALEQNKIHMMILKHQMDRLKIEDAIRGRALQTQNLELLQGLPEADLPTEPTQESNLPSNNMAGFMTGLIRDSMGGDNQAPPETVAAPQATMPGTHAGTRRAAVNIPGIPELGVSGVSVRPRSMEELNRAMMLAKLSEPRIIPRGGTLEAGGQVIAQGAAPATTRAQLELDAAGGDAAAAAANLRRSTTESRPVQTDVLLDGQEAKVLFDPKTKRYSDLSGAAIDNAATRIRPLRRTAQSTDPDRAARLQYDEFLKTYKAANPTPTVGERNAAATSEFAPKVTMPEPPPSFEKWKAMTPPERQTVIRNPKSRIDDAELQRRAQGKGGGTKAAAGGVTVSYQGKTYRFPDQQSADGFKKELGIQ